MQETRVLSLGQEDPLVKEMVAHSSILAWEISWTEEPGGGGIYVPHQVFAGMSIDGAIAFSVLFS